MGRRKGAERRLLRGSGVGRLWLERALGVARAAAPQLCAMSEGTQRTPRRRDGATLLARATR